MCLKFEADMARLFIWSMYNHTWIVCWHFAFKRAACSCRTFNKCPMAITVFMRGHGKTWIATLGVSKKLVKLSTAGGAALSGSSIMHWLEI